MCHRLLIAAVLLAAAPRPSRAETFRGWLTLDDFEATAQGEHWTPIQFSGGATPAAFIEAGPARSGSRSCRLLVPPGATLTLAARHAADAGHPARAPSLPIPGRPEHVGVWVFGQQSGHRLWLRLRDATGHNHDVSLGAVDFDGWRFLGAPALGIPAPVGVSALLVRGGRGPLVLDDLMAAVSSARRLHLRVAPAEPGRDHTDADRLACRVVLQSLDDAPLRGTGRLEARDAAEQGGPAVAAARFRFEVSQAKPFAATLRLRLPAGSYRLVARAGEAESVRPVAVFPTRRPTRESEAAALRRFRRRGDDLRVYQTGCSPAIVVETAGRSLTLFRPSGPRSLPIPQQMLARVSPHGTTLLEPWILLWFGAAPELKSVTLADGSPCPTFDVPFLLVLDRQPSSWRIGEGLELHFARPGARVVVMPLFGVKPASPALTTSWHGTSEAIARTAETCRSWASLLRAVPVGVTEECRVDAEADVVEFRSTFHYLDLAGSFGPRPRRVAPVPPLLALAREAGLPIRFSRQPAPTGCHTSVGPYLVVPDTRSYTYSISGLLRFVLRAVADVPPGVPAAQLSLAPSGRSLAEDAPKIPFWVAHEDPVGRQAAAALVSLMLAPSNAPARYDRATGRCLALDAVAARTFGEHAAFPAVAGLLRGAWYAGFHAGAWDVLRRRWPRLAALHNTVALGDDWATLGAGARPWPLDARLNAEVYFARLAGRLAPDADYAQACARAVRLLAAAAAFAKTAPRHARDLGTWPPAPAGAERPAAGCRPGSLGFRAGPPPLVSLPCDAGYGFAAEFLAGYYRQRFSGGPLDFFGRSPAEWSQRLLVALAPPRGSERFVPLPPPDGPFATNYVFSVESTADGWPAIVWRSHKLPAGGPLVLCAIATDPVSKGRLVRSHTPSPWLRMSAYRAVTAPPPPKAPAPPPPR